MMGNLEIKIGEDFNTNSVAEEITYHLEEANYDMRAIEITVSESIIYIKSDIVYFDQNFLDVVDEASDGYRIGISLDE